MALVKDIFDTAVGVTRRAVAIGIGVVQRLRSDERDADVVTPPAAPSAAPEAVGAPRPGRSGGPKSSTTTSRAGRSKPVAKPAAASTKPGAAVKAPEAGPAAAPKPPKPASADAGAQPEE